MWTRHWRFDVASFVTSVKLADDCKLFRPVSNYVDKLSLQQGLDSVSNWVTKGHMEFNVYGCKVMHCGRSNMVTAIVWIVNQLQ